MKCLKLLFLYKRTLKVKCHSALRLKSPTPIGPKLSEDDELGMQTLSQKEKNEIYANEPLIYQLVNSKDYFQGFFQENIYDCNHLKILSRSCAERDDLERIVCRRLSTPTHHLRGGLRWSEEFHRYFTGHIIGLSTLTMTCVTLTLILKRKIQKFETQWNNTCKNKPNLM